MTFHELTANPSFGVAVTVIAYALAQRIHARYRALHPLFLTTGSIIALLLLTGIPYTDYEVGGVMAVLTGLLGSMVGPELLRLAGVRGDIPIGVAVGTSAHGIGTARVLRESELQGGVSGFAMSIAGLVTSLAAIPLYYWLQ